MNSTVPSQFDQLSLSRSPDALIFVTPAGTIRHWSEGAQHVFGYSAEEAVGRAVVSLLAPLGRDEEQQIVLAETMARGTATFESLRRRKDGTLIYVATTALLIDASDAGERLIMLTKKDVTHLRVRRDTRQVEARFRDLLESTPDGIVMVDPTGSIVFANTHAHILFGYGSGDLSGKLVEELLPARFREAHSGHRANFFARPRSRAMGAGLDLFGLRMDGSEFPIEISLSPLRMDDTSFVIGAIRDISVRKKSEQKFRALLESGADATVIVDAKGHIVLVNSQAEKLFGYSSAELLNQSVELLMPTRYRAAHPGHRDGFFAQPRVRPMGASMELFARRKDGSEFPAEIFLSPLETEDGPLVSSNIRDISDRKFIANELREKNVALEHASRAKDLFLASMSHELRTPLNAIIGFTGTLLMKLPGPLNPEQEKQLRVVQASARHLLSLISDLLDIAKIEADKLEMNRESIDIGEVLDEVVASLRPLADRKALNLSVTMPHRPLMFISDRRALTQIIINLIDNAIKYTSQGFIRVTADESRSTTGHVVTIEVHDSGPGILEEDQTKLFRAFSRLSIPNERQQLGTGLGLHLSRRMAEQLGGNVRCRSEPGRGSVFTLELREA